MGTKKNPHTDMDFGRLPFCWTTHTRTHTTKSWEIWIWENSN